VLPKFLDVQGNVLAGRGVNSYGVGASFDYTIGAFGEPQPIEGVSFSAGATLHATPALDLYVFGGQQKVEANYFLNTVNPLAGTYIGYGISTANNTCCSVEGALAGICNGVVESLWQVTAYNGEFGQVRLGLQYSYTKKNLFAGYGGLVAEVIA
jgi:hypothetical protein